VYEIDALLFVIRKYIDCQVFSRILDSIFFIRNKNFVKIKKFTISYFAIVTCRKISK